MPRRARLVIASLLVAMMGAAPARSATMIGDLSPPSDNYTEQQTLYLQSADSTGHVYAVPAGGGVITSLSALTRIADSGYSDSARIVVYSLNGSTASVSGSGTITVDGPPGEATRSVATRIKVHGGERLGVLTTKTAGGGIADKLSSGTVRYQSAFSGSLSDGAMFDQSGFSSAMGAVLVGATIEPDADDDGYGDETQDRCPDDPAIHDSSCLANLVETAAASASTIAVGDVAIVTVTASNAGPAIARAVSAALDVPAGLEALAVVDAYGDCASLTCPLGDIGAGASRRLVLVARGTAPGTHTIGAHLTSTTPDPDPATNAAGATLVVNQAPTSSAVTLCTVPRLKGKTLTAARAALKRARCAAGAVHGSRRRGAKVKVQSIPAGVKVLAGTKVALALRGARKHAH